MKKIILILLIIFGISACDKRTAQENLDLGLSYYKGNKEKNIEQDYEKAFKFLKKSTSQGNLDAQHELAGLYMYGTGIQRDHKKAMSLYEDAAEKGNIESQVTMANAFLRSDFDKGIAWFTKAAKQGDFLSLYMLGLLHEMKDKDKALEWYKKAATNKTNTEKQTTLALGAIKLLESE